MRNRNKESSEIIDFLTARMEGRRQLGWMEKE
jgi:hypothetical protein